MQPTDTVITCISVSDKDKSVEEIRKEAKRLLRQIKLEKQALARLKEAQAQDKEK